MLSCRDFFPKTGMSRIFCIEPREAAVILNAINCTPRIPPVPGHRNRDRTGVPGNNAGERGGIIVLTEGKTHGRMKKQHTKRGLKKY